MSSGSNKRTFCGLLLLFGLVFSLIGAAHAQGPAAPETGEKTKAVSDAPSSAVKPTPAVKANETASHRFWDRKNVMLFAGVGASRGLDYASTRNMQSRGREEILLPDDVVNNTAAFVAVEAGATAASVGISYLLHRTGHHKLERWLSIGHIGVTTFGAARNYALETKR